MNHTTKALLIMGTLLTSAVLHAAEQPRIAAPAKPQAKAESGDLSTLSRPFFQAHCLRCHGPKEAKGGLRLDQLEADLSRPAVFQRWQEIAARVRAGAMPPPGEPRPKPEQVAGVLQRISTQLDAAVAKQRAEGRVVLRRLNRVEYENTVRDLFACRAAVKEMLPEDTISHGFDNVGAALNVSPSLVERYLEAADAVLDSAVAPVHRLESTTRRFDLYDSLPNWFQPRVWKQDDGVILFSPQNESATALEKFRAPAPGRYRFRINASTHHSEGPLPLAVLLGYFNVNGQPIQHHGYYDVPPGKPTVVEFEHRILAKNDTLKIGPVDMPFVYLNQKNMPEYPGPGLKIHWVEIEGPLPEAWPTESYRRVFGDVDPKSGTLADAEKLLRALLPRAFRRPLVEGEERPYVALVEASLQSGQSFEVSLRAGIKGVLASPKFLYLREPAGPLEDYALATRLSYFLWSTMPDETLFALAAKGELRRPEVLRAQVERMLADPKAAAFTENFTGQWLGLRNIEATTPDKKLYPEYDELLQWSSVQETQRFFDELLREDLSVRNFIDSDFALLNGRLAKQYGIPGVEGLAFRKVPLRPEYHRGGVLTQASVLKVTANGTNTSPVLRGAWVLDRILGRPAPPPPPNVPAIEPDIRGAATIREQLTKHRESPACAGCHARIDPPGFALENYDAIGGWREKYRVVTDRDHWVKNRVGPLAPYLAAWQYGLGKPVEAGSTLDGTPFADLSELKKLLLAHPEQIARSVAEKLITYSTGQPPGPADQQAVEAIVNKTKSSNYGLRSIVHAVVASDLFRRK